MTKVAEAALADALRSISMLAPKWPLNFLRALMARPIPVPRLRGPSRSNDASPLLNPERSSWSLGRT